MTNEKLDEALAILAIALPGPRPWPTEGAEAKLRIYRNMAEDRCRTRDQVGDLAIEIARLQERDIAVRAEFENFRRGLCNFGELASAIEGSAHETRATDAQCSNEFTHAGSWDCDAMLAKVIEADRTLLQVADEHDGQFLVFTVKEAQSFRDWLNRVLPTHKPLQVGSFPVKVVIDPKMPPGEMVMSNSLGQSVRVTGLRDPLPPEILADALQDVVHTDPGPVRTGRAVKSEACGSHGPNDVIGCELPKGHGGLCDYEDPRADWEK
jgi:hypothetical protein